jgi:hypothetical protein
MMLALIFAFHVPIDIHLHHHRPAAPKPIVAHGHLRHWRWDVRQDRFSSRFTCSLRAHDVHVRSGAAIFDLGHGVETTHAFYRIDARPPAPVSDHFIALHKLNIFPEKGWIDNPDGGGEAALPLTTLDDGQRVWIRANGRSKVHYYDVAGLNQALGAMHKAGCPAWLP